MTLKTLVVMPAFNEARIIGETLRSLVQTTGLPVLVVDDGSTDDTKVIAREAGARVLPLVSQLGAWGATQTGIRYALKNGYDTTITIDADGQHNALEIEALLACLKREEADLVIGSCTGRGSRARKLAWVLFRALSGLNIDDLTSGFRAYSRKSMETMARAEATGLDYQDIGVLCMLRQQGLRITEIDVCMYPRKDGKSRIFNSWLSVFRYMAYSVLLSLSHFKPAMRR
jgi:glycosyltransferase involved in cell wall biosynthesis